MIITLNPQFAIRNESECSYIVKRNWEIDAAIGKDVASITIIPPVIGYILNTIGLFDYNESLKKISKELNVSEQAIDNFTQSLLSNEAKGLKIGDDIIKFPQRLLIKSKKIIISMMRPIMEPRFFLKRLQISFAWLGRLKVTTSSSAAAAAPAVTAALSLSSSILFSLRTGILGAYARVYKRVEHVDQEHYDREHDRDQDGSGDDDRLILIAYPVDYQASDAGQREHPLYYDGAADKHTEAHAYHCYNGKQSVFKRVLPDDRAFRSALCPGRTDIVLPHGFEHG